MLKILESVASEKLGYSYGKPLRVDKKSCAVVLPIVRETSLHRQYITFPETEQVHVFDTGSIDKMEADNQTAENVFIRSGTLFKGATQERALQRSAVLFPGKKQTLYVRCVHMSKGIGGGTKVTYGGITPLDVDKGVYEHGYIPKDQQSFWNNVQSSNFKMAASMGKGFASAAAPSGIIRARSGNEEIPVGASAFFSSFQMGSHPNLSDDLVGNFNEFSLHFESLLSKVKRITNQVGLALINQNGVETVEFFDHQLSWKALHECAIKRLGSNIVDPGNASVFEYKPENAIRAVNEVLGMDYKTNRIYHHRPSNGEPEVEITGLTAKEYVGEAVELNGSLVHLVLLKTN